MQVFIDLLQQSTGRVFTSNDIRLLNSVFLTCSNISDVFNKRPSHVAFQNCMTYTRNSENAIASALLSMNGDHAPFSECFSMVDLLIEKDVDFIKKYVKFVIDSGNKIIGFGNPMFKKKEENEARAIRISNNLPFEYVELRKNIEQSLSFLNINIYANLVFYITCATHSLGFPKSHASILFLIPTILTYLNSWQQH